MPVLVLLLGCSPSEATPEDGLSEFERSAPCYGMKAIRVVGTIPENSRTYRDGAVDGMFSEDYQIATGLLASSDGERYAVRWQWRWSERFGDHNWLDTGRHSFVLAQIPGDVSWAIVKFDNLNVIGTEAFEAWPNCVVLWVPGLPEEYQQNWYKSVERARSKQSH